MSENSTPKKKVAPTATSAKPSAKVKSAEKSASAGTVKKETATASAAQHLQIRVAKVRRPEIRTTEVRPTQG